jgi:hypothetical protein
MVRIKTTPHIPVSTSVRAGELKQLRNRTAKASKTSRNSPVVANSSQKRLRVGGRPPPSPRTTRANPSPASSTSKRLRPRVYRRTEHSPPYSASKSPNLPPTRRVSPRSKAKFQRSSSKTPPKSSSTGSRNDSVLDGIGEHASTFFQSEGSNDDVSDGTFLRGTPPGEDSWLVRDKVVEIGPPDDNDDGHDDEALGSPACNTRQRTASQPAIHGDDSDPDSDVEGMTEIDDPQPKRKRTVSEKRALKRQRNLVILQRNGWASWIGAVARQAVFIATPWQGEGPAPHQHLYWPNQPVEACALQLISRSQRLREHAVQYGGNQAFALQIATEVHHHSRKARNKHIHQLKVLFFSNNSPFQIAENVTKNVGHMQMLPKFGPDLNTTEQMVDLLMSSNLHAHERFYPHFVAALGSGKLCKVKKQSSATPLHEFVAIDYEAHFRLELWNCLKRQGEKYSTTSPPLPLTPPRNFLFVVRIQARLH